MVSFLNHFRRCSFNNDGAEPALEDEEHFTFDPALLESDIARQESRKIFSRLTSAQQPSVIKKDGEATVNFAVLRSEGGHDRPWSHFQRVASNRTGTAASGLEWTESRKLLEAAIAVEQVLPSMDPALQYRVDLMAEEERLLARLYDLGLDMEVQAGDGNCQFRSLSVGLFGTPHHHLIVRRTTLNYVHRHKRDFEAFLGEDFRVWAKQMGKCGVWGDELTLRAACEAYGVVVNVVTSDASGWFLRYIPERSIVQKEVFLCYIAPVHYNAIRRRPRGVAPMLRTMSSLGRRNSRIVAALDEYERNRAMPTTPTDVLT
jgi:hypothetical protein